MKVCTKCGEAKAADEFYRRKSATDGLASWCKGCYREWREKPENKSVRAARSSEWAKANRGKRRANDKRWRDKKTKEYHNGRAADWKKRNPERAAEIWAAASRRNSQRLTRTYVAGQLRLPATDVTPELEAAKREQIELHRITKQLTEALKEATK